MKTSNSVFIGTLLELIGLVMQRTGASISSAATTCDSSDPELRTHFRQRGIDEADVTDERINGALGTLGLNCGSLRPFGEMLEVAKQHAAGLVTDSEMILALQCSPTQIQNLIAHTNLPYKISVKTAITDWDPEVPGFEGWSTDSAPMGLESEED